MKKVGIIGHFGKDKGQISGQIIKTENLHGAFKKYTDFDVICVDTYSWKKHPFKLYNAIKSAFEKCDAIIMLPAQNGVKIFAPVLVRLKKRYNKKIYYDVIGGWLTQILEKKKRLSHKLKAFDGIWVETAFMEKKLKQMGFDNVNIVPNFKDLTAIDKEKISCNDSLPLKLCTFSRISRQKGIEDAVDAVRNVNKKLGYSAFTLDIYGGVEKGEEDWFDTLQKKFVDGACTYKGVVQSQQSVQVLKDYYALVFPTRFFTEGVPGTIIDAYCAGLPVISARWQSFDDVIDDKSGIGYEFGNIEAFEDILCDIAKKQTDIKGMKEYCLEQAEKYTAKNVICRITQLLDR